MRFDIAWLSLTQDSLKLIKFFKPWDYEVCLAG